MTTYSISLDDVDLALLPLPTYPYNNFLKKERYQFQVLKTEPEDDTATEQVTTPDPTILYKCHICAIELPAAFASEHAASQKHRANVRIASVAAERMRAYITSLPPLHATRTSTRFCTNCSKEAEDGHEKTNEHRAAVMLDSLLWDLMKAYVQDHDESAHEASSYPTDGNNNKPVINGQGVDNLKYEDENSNNIDDNNNKPTKHTEEKVEQEEEETEKHSDTNDNSDKSTRDNITSSSSKTEGTSTREIIFKRDKEHYGEKIRRFLNDEDNFEYKESTKISIKFNDNIINNIDSDNYHSYDKRNDGSINCMVCDCVIDDKDAEAHKYDFKHLRRVANLGKDGRYIREINEFYSHCILCNLKIENIDLATHKESSTHSVKEYLYTNTRSGNVKEHIEAERTSVQLEERSKHELDESLHIYSENEEQNNVEDDYSDNEELDVNMEEYDETEERTGLTYGDSSCFIVSVNDNSEQYSENEELNDSIKKDYDDGETNASIEEHSKNEEIIYIPEESSEYEEPDCSTKEDSSDEDPKNDSLEENGEHEEIMRIPEESCEHEEPKYSSNKVCNNEIPNNVSLVENSESEEIISIPDESCENFEHSNLEVTNEYVKSDDNFSEHEKLNYSQSDEYQELEDENEENEIKNTENVELGNHKEDEDELLTDDVTKNAADTTNSSHGINTQSTAPMEDKIERTPGKFKRNPAKYDLKKYGGQLLEHIEHKEYFEFKETFMMVHIKLKNNSLYTYSDRFHSYERMRDKGIVKCIVCDSTFNIDDADDHKLDTEHMRKIAKLGKKGNYIREIDETYSHCILCNVKIKNKEIAAHKDLLSHNFGIRLFTQSTKKVDEDFLTEEDTTDQSTEDCESETFNSDDENEIEISHSYNTSADILECNKIEDREIEVTNNSINIEKVEDLELELLEALEESFGSKDELETNDENPKNEIGDYGHELRKLIDSQCDFEFYEIANSIRIRINNDILHIYNDNFHSFDRKYFSGRIKCIVCDCILKFEDADDHKFDIKHMSKIINLGNDRDYVRKVDESYSHCILCNLKIKNENLDAHKRILMHTIKKDLYTCNADDTKKEVTSPKTSSKICGDEVSNEENTTKDHLTTKNPLLNSKYEYPCKAKGMEHVTIEKYIYTSNTVDTKKEIAAAKTDSKTNKDRMSNEKNTPNEVTGKNIDVIVGVGSKDENVDEDVDEDEYEEEEYFEDIGWPLVICLVCKCKVPNNTRNKEEHLIGWRHQQRNMARKKNA